MPTAAITRREPRVGNGGAVFYVRSGIGSTPMYAQLRAAVRGVDPALPVFGMKTLEAQLDETLQTDRLIALLSGAFGLSAALLASIGLYGVMAFVVARRNKELGIRLALGATRGGVVWLVMREVLLLLGLGLAVGGIAAIGTGAALDSWLGFSVGLYNVKMHDPLTAIAALLLLAAAAALAGLIPARRAGRINPIMTLRYE